MKPFSKQSARQGSMPFLHLQSHDLPFHVFHREALGRILEDEKPPGRPCESNPIPATALSGMSFMTDHDLKTKPRSLPAKPHMRSKPH